jgi:hypothetical protein
MALGTLLLSSFLSFTPLQKDSTKINLNFPKIENKTQEIPISLNQLKIQYNIPISKNTFLFTEYESPKNFYKPKIENKKIPYLSTGIKINF